MEKVEKDVVALGQDNNLSGAVIRSQYGTPRALSSVNFYIPYEEVKFVRRFLGDIETAPFIRVYMKPPFPQTVARTSIGSTITAEAMSMDIPWDEGGMEIWQQLKSPMQ